MDMTLADVEKDIKTRLQQGATSRKSAMHTCVVATADCDLRVMVLREYCSETNRLRFHTDSRTPKVTAIAGNPSVAVLAYDQQGKVQIRMRGTARIEQDGPVADAAWAEATNFAKRCYLAQQAPSSAVPEPTSGLPQWAEGTNPADDEVAPARDNFAVLLIEIAQFDWLYLANEGHRRARITPGEDGAEPDRTWLVP
ncbi:flavin-binding protein [Altererythrobacter luteolus]|uniref:Flavin-binding protein n=1 Tax=Pontixanthobacter luteolus TaxID=295089 RepID=A0A6I4UZF7_9SPHN|nr:pyridoxamine 5'-phosphate oxidase family protein [Pontixanthobacter luteolus]MXP46978.1 flavin-binding protein [Pontixanthobacter luteolus]